MSGSRGFILAHLLGPSGYGVLGGLIAFQQMLSYSALGMREGVLIQLSRLGPEDPRQVSVYSSAIVFAVAIGLLLPFVCSVYWLLVHGRIDGNYLLACLIGGVTVLNEVLINLNRYENRLKRISACEVTYNLLILGSIFAFYRVIDVPLVLLSTLLAIAVSAAVYLTRLRFFSLRSVRWPTVTDLVGSGFPSSVLSGLLIVVNLIFILLAQRHLPKAEVGQYVFANNIATVIMVSLNAFSWAMTSRSMSDHASADKEEARRESIRRTDVYMRLGLAGALVLAILAAICLPWVTERYADSGRYVLLFVALQSFQLLIFTELTFVMMKNRVWALIGIFAVANLINYALIEGMSWRISFDGVMVAAIVCVAIATLAVMRYARSIGLHAVGGQRYASIAAILAAVGLSYGSGIEIALLVTVVFMAFVFVSNRKQVMAVFD